MDIKSHQVNSILQLTLSGRLDTFGSNELEKVFADQINLDVLCVVIDMAQVDYISSAGLRILMSRMKKLKSRQGAMALCGIQPFCKDVLESTGLADLFLQFERVSDAEQFCRQLHDGISCARQWDQTDPIEINGGTLIFQQASSDAAALTVAGDLKNIQHAKITPDEMYAIPYKPREYSIGIGGMGAKPDDCFSIMGDMITAGHMIAWRPTDSHHLPDFLVPRSDTVRLPLQTAFRVSLSGSFNEWVLFDSNHENGTPLKHLYKELFRISKERRKDYKGVLALVMRVQCNHVSGSSLRRAPIESMAPANGKLIDHPSNIEEWFISDKERTSESSGLLCAFGANLKDDLSDFDEELFNRVFYLNPFNAPTQTQRIHANGILFQRFPLDARPSDIHTEASKLIDQGQFVDTCRISDSTEIVRAVIGIAYIQSIAKVDAPKNEIPLPPEADLQPTTQKQMAYYKGLRMR